MILQDKGEVGGSIPSGTTKSCNASVRARFNFDKTKAKEEQFPKDKKLVMLKKDEMLPILKYVFDKYGDDFTKLYDKG